MVELERVLAEAEVDNPYGSTAVSVRRQLKSLKAKGLEHGLAVLSIEVGLQVRLLALREQEQYPLQILRLRQLRPLSLDRWLSNQQYAGVAASMMEAASTEKGDSSNAKKKKKKLPTLRPSALLNTGGGARAHFSRMLDDGGGDEEDAARTEDGKKAIEMTRKQSAKAVQDAGKDAAKVEGRPAMASKNVRNRPVVPYARKKKGVEDLAIKSRRASETNHRRRSSSSHSASSSSSSSSSNSSSSSSSGSGSDSDSSSSESENERRGSSSLIVSDEALSKRLSKKTSSKSVLRASMSSKALVKMMSAKSGLAMSDSLDTEDQPKPSTTRKPPAPTMKPPAPRKVVTPPSVRRKHSEAGPPSPLSPTSKYWSNYDVQPAPSPSSSSSSSQHQQRQQPTETSSDEPTSLTSPSSAFEQDNPLAALVAASSSSPGASFDQAPAALGDENESISAAITSDELFAMAEASLQSEHALETSSSSASSSSSSSSEGGRVLRAPSGADESPPMLTAHSNDFLEGTSNIHPQQQQLPQQRGRAMSAVPPSTLNREGLQQQQQQQLPSRSIYASRPFELSAVGRRGSIAGRGGAHHSSARPSQSPPRKASHSPPPPRLRAKSSPAKPLKEELNQATVEEKEEEDLSPAAAEFTRRNSITRPSDKQSSNNTAPPRRPYALSPVTVTTSGEELTPPADVSPAEASQPKVDTTTGRRPSFSSGPAVRGASLTRPTLPSTSRAPTNNSGTSNRRDPLAASSNRPSQSPARPSHSSPRSQSSPRSSNSVPRPRAKPSGGVVSVPPPEAKQQLPAEEKASSNDDVNSEPTESPKFSNSEGSTRSRNESSDGPGTRKMNSHPQGSSPVRPPPLAASSNRPSQSPARPSHSSPRSSNSVPRPRANPSGGVVSASPPDAKQQLPVAEEASTNDDAKSEPSESPKFSNSEGSTRSRNESSEGPGTRKTNSPPRGSSPVRPPPRKRVVSPPPPRARTQSPVNVDASGEDSTPTPTTPTSPPSGASSPTSATPPTLPMKSNSPSPKLADTSRPTVASTSARSPAVRGKSPSRPPNDPTATTRRSPLPPPSRPSQSPARSSHSSPRPRAHLPPAAGGGGGAAAVAGGAAAGGTTSSTTEASPPRAPSSSAVPPKGGATAGSAGCARGKSPTRPTTPPMAGPAPSSANDSASPVATTEKVAKVVKPRRPVVKRGEEARSPTDS